MSKRYVHKIDLKNVKGMIPLDMYIPLSYFSYKTSNDKEDNYYSLGDLEIILTECLSTAIIKGALNIEELEKERIAAPDIYISSIPSALSGEMRNNIVFYYNNNYILVSEATFKDKNNNPIEDEKCKDLKTEDILDIILYSRGNAITLINDVINNCEDIKESWEDFKDYSEPKENKVEENAPNTNASSNVEEIKPIEDDIFNLSNYKAI